MKTNKGILSDEELKKRTRFWNKKQFRTWTEKEMNRDAAYMQKILAAIKGFNMSEIEIIRHSDSDNFRAYVGGRRARRNNDPKSIIRMAGRKDLEYAISIAPKTFKCKKS